MKSPLFLSAPHALFLITAVFGTACDLGSKYLLFSPPMYEDAFIVNRTELIPPFVAIQCSWNSGALFGIGQGWGALFVAFSIVAVVIIPIVHVRLARFTGLWHAFGLGAIEAGALGNLYDRLRYGRVRDFIHLQWGQYSWPTFNIADALICAGLAALLLSAFRKPQSETPLASAS